MLQLFSALPDHVGGSRTDAGQRPRDDVGREFVPRDVERRFSFNSVPIREGTVLNVARNSLICLAHRVRAEGGNALSDR